MTRHTSAANSRLPVPVANSTLRAVAGLGPSRPTLGAGQVRPPGEVGVDPDRGRAGKRKAPAVTVAAGDPQHPAALLGAEVPDVSADHLGDPGAGEQQHRRQRRGARPLRARCRVGRADEP